MKFVFYGRVSTSKQGLDGYGLAAQREAVNRYLTAMPGAELIASFEEVESGANNARPQLKAAIDLCKARGARLLISKLDRLSRSAQFLLQLMESGADFVITEMPAADKFTISILACVAQREREMIGERTRAGLAIAKARGVKLGNPRLHEARQNALRAIQSRKDSFAASAIHSIRDIQSTGVTSLNKISIYLNKRGERTARGGAWTATAVKRILANTNTRAI